MLNHAPSSGALVARAERGVATLILMLWLPVLLICLGIAVETARLALASLTLKGALDDAARAARSEPARADDLVSTYLADAFAEQPGIVPVGQWTGTHARGTIVVPALFGPFGPVTLAAESD